MDPLKELKIILKSLLISCPNKMSIHELDKDYRISEGGGIPFRIHGFDSLEGFLKSLTDTVKVGLDLFLLHFPLKIFSYFFFSNLSMKIIWILFYYINIFFLYNLYDKFCYYYFFLDFNFIYNLKFISIRLIFI